MIYNSINIVIYILICMSVYLIFEDFIFNIFYSSYRLIYRKKESAIYQHIKKIFISTCEITSSKQLEKKINSFIAFSLLILIMMFSVVFKYNVNSNTIIKAFFNSLLTSLIVAAVPYVIIRIKLYKIRQNSSKEALIVVTEILNQYKLHCDNIIEAIDASVRKLDKNIICRRFLARLSMRLKVYKNDKELSECLDEFVFSVDTNWIRLLSDSIMFSIQNNINITQSLEGIIEQIGSIEATKSQSNRMNNEGFVMAKYMAPLLYIILIFVGNKMMGFNLNDIFAYQLTGQGLKYAIIIISLYILCLTVEYLFKSRKYDF